MLSETFDSTENGGTADDRHTAYGYDNTTRTGKTVHEGLDDTGTVRSQTSMTYNEMGRLASTTVTTYDTGGVQLSEVVTEYGYDDNGLRVTETTTTDGGTPVVKSFLFDPRNPTGFAQVLEEYVDGVLDQVYALGHDVIQQTDVSDTQNQDVYTLLGDGHGSTRALLDELNAIVQQFAYDAYGNMLEGTNLTAAANALTSLLYSGEWTGANGQQYLRARFYDPASGTFNRLDSYFGNLRDPQSLHKYLYAHANPVAFWDPSGEVTINFNLNLGFALRATAVLISLAALVRFLVIPAYNFVTSLDRAADANDATPDQVRDILASGTRHFNSHPRAQEFMRDLELGQFRVRIIPDSEYSEGMSLMFSRDVFISETSINEGPEAAFLLAFAEWQHTPEGGSLPDSQDTQDEFHEIRQLLPNELLTPYIRSLVHGGTENQYSD